MVSLLKVGSSVPNGSILYPPSATIATVSATLPATARVHPNAVGAPVRTQQVHAVAHPSMPVTICHSAITLSRSVHSAEEHTMRQRGTALSGQMSLRVVSPATRHLGATFTCLTSNTTVPPTSTCCPETPYLILFLLIHSTGGPSATQLHRVTPPFRARVPFPLSPPS